MISNKFSEPEDSLDDKPHREVLMANSDYWFRQRHASVAKTPIFMVLTDTVMGYITLNQPKPKPSLTGEERRVIYLLMTGLSYQMAHSPG